MRYDDIFREKRIKQTQQRKEVFSALLDANKPLSLDEIQFVCSKVDFSSIYRAIKVFIEKGIVAEHYFGDRKPKYSLMLDKSHHHFIKCVNCGKIEELKNICILDEVNQKTKYKIVDHYMEFTGICPGCSKK